jgi:N-terminal domain of reverse transcriptase
MTAATTAGAASHGAVEWHAIDWQKAHQTVRRLQARIVKATQAGRWGKVKALQRLLTRGETALLTERWKGLSCMKGNFHVQFLGEELAVTSSPYPAAGWATAGSTRKPTALPPLRTGRAGAEFRC